MLTVVAGASLLRAILTSAHWPFANSDEGFMDLMASHIAFRGERPVFFYGQAYMGPVEAYVGAVCFRLFGISVFSLRLGVIAFFALFLICMYFLTRLLYTRRLALATVLLLGLGSSEVVSHQLKAIGGYPELPLFAALILLLASKLALSSHPRLTPFTTGQRWLRRLAFGLLGFLMGFSFWIDQLIFPFVLAAILLVLFFCWRELRLWAGFSLILGVLLGAWPLIQYNLHALPGQTTLASLQKINAVGYKTMSTGHIPVVRQLVGAVLFSLPAMTGLNPLCSAENFPLFGPTTTSTARCVAMHGAWAGGYLLLWGLAAAMAGLVIWRQWRQTAVRSWSFEQRETVIRQTARLMLLMGAMLTLITFVITPTAAFASNDRYLTCTLMAAPALLWPLWNGLHPRKLFSLSPSTLVHLIRISIIALVFAMFANGAVQIFTEVPAAIASYNQQNDLIEHLLNIGATRFYTDYWTCSRLIFQSDERLICSSVSESLNPDPALDRYQPYRTIMMHAARPSYVFAIGTASGLRQARNFERKSHRLHIHYQLYRFDGCAVYVPAVRFSLL
ncbi:MAG TPA: hypothetical protein VKX46_00715 [Ktedonobacteraceae bacterium]|nr:hypothetical protein [Ktedonobacteraceae bacterium]